MALVVLVEVHQLVMLVLLHMVGGEVGEEVLRLLLVDLGVVPYTVREAVEAVEA